MSSRRLFEDPGAEEFRGLSLLTLGIDQAWLVLNSSLPETTWLYVRSDDCRQVIRPRQVKVPSQSIQGSALSRAAVILE